MMLQMYVEFVDDDDNTSKTTGYPFKVLTLVPISVLVLIVT